MTEFEEVLVCIWILFTIFAEEGFVNEFIYKNESQQKYCDNINRKGTCVYEP